jgi:hypothetical protein
MGRSLILVLEDGWMGGKYKFEAGGESIMVLRIVRRNCDTGQALIECIWDIGGVRVWDKFLLHQEAALVEPRMEH